MPPTDSTPIFRMQKMYVKDLSFENPSAPQVYAEPGEPKVDFRLNVSNRTVDDEHWEVAISVTANVTSQEKTVFIVEVEHAGLFQLRNIPAEHMDRVLGVECPALLFPFTRQIVAQATIDGGFVPLLMDPINFLAMYEANVLARQQAEKH
ncbi:MAG: protein-export chaperone SecB [Deltaproteobacteria bacterium]|nr:protein-export chaperone SecB [Deltaproteobacteria bacterium]